MKKTLIGLSIVLLLAGCSSAEASEDGPQKFQPFVWTDKDTGCDYLIVHTDYYGGGSITPRMLNDGTQLCN